MKILIVTYYWPPAGGSGVQRWLKFVKYLQEFDVEPVVYTVDNPKYPIIDAALEKEIPTNITVLKQPIREPNNILSLFKKKKAKQSSGFLNPNPSFVGRILQYIRANYFIPDARKYWVKPSVKYLKEYLSKHQIDAVITSGPPHSLHLIGLELKKDLGIKWISDFRDPWTEIDYFEQLPLTQKSIQRHHQLEKKKFKQYSDRIYVLTNGFDTEEHATNITVDSKFTITHVGLINADRNPFSFWKALADICSVNEEFANDYQVNIVGKIAPEVEQSIADSKLKNVEYIGYVSHDKVKSYQNNTQVLLLAVNNVKSAKGIITGKIFEYLQAKRPILAIGPIDGDLAKIINDTNSGKIVDFEDVETLRDEILNLYREYKDGSLSVESKNIEQYHRKKLTERLSEIIKEVVSYYL